jgi:uncharacterized protein YggE
MLRAAMPLVVPLTILQRPTEEKEKPGLRLRRWAGLHMQIASRKETRMNHLIAAMAALLAIFFAPMAAAAEGPSLTVSGTGEIAAAPDMAVISLGVTHEAAEAAEAMAAVSAAMARILERLQAEGIAPEDLQTNRISLGPVWSNRSGNDGSPPEITGFQAQSDLTVRVRDLTRLGAVLDRVLQDGANQFSGLRFLVADPEPLMRAAREAAIRDAMAKAREMAAAAGVTLGPITEITEQGGGRPRPMMAEMASVRDAGVPVAPGEITLEASVSMVFAIAE